MKLIAGIFKFFLGCVLLVIILATFGIAFENSSSHTSQPEQSAPVAAVAAPRGGEEGCITAADLDMASWEYNQSKDKMRNSTNFYARIASKNSIKFDLLCTPLYINLQKSAASGDGVYLSVQNGQFDCNAYDCRVWAKFDDGPVQTLVGEEMRSGNIKLQSYKSFVNGMKKAERLTLEVVFYKRGREQFTFDVSGLEWEHFGNAAPKRKRRR